MFDLIFKKLNKIGDFLKEYANLIMVIAIIILLITTNEPEKDAGRLAFIIVYMGFYIRDSLKIHITKTLENKK